MILQRKQSVNFFKEYPTFVVPKEDASGRIRTENLHFPSTPIKIDAQQMILILSLQLRNMRRNKF